MKQALIAQLARSTSRQLALAYESCSMGPRLTCVAEQLLSMRWFLISKVGI